MYCEKEGRTQPAEVVDHIRAHKGNDELFWDKENWQSLCKSCHDSVKQSEERNDRQAIGEDGWPVT